MQTIQLNMHIHSSLSVQSRLHHGRECNTGNNIVYILFKMMISSNSVFFPSSDIHKIASLEPRSSTQFMAARKTVWKAWV